MTTVFHLIILDESGSMTPLTKQTVEGCNETLNVVRTLQKEFGDTQRHLVSIYLFQSGSNIPSRYLIKNLPIGEVHDLRHDQYKPWGCTPLLDAVGSTLVDLEAVASTHEDATAMVTIITDGEENSSQHYSFHKVASIISRLKELGWTFNFIGANIDVERMAKQMAIDNSMAFDATTAGTAAMWADTKEKIYQAEKRRAYAEEAEPLMSREERIKLRKEMAAKFHHPDANPRRR